MLTQTVSPLLQAGPSLTGQGLVAVLGTILLGWAFYAVTLHLAATFFVGDVPTQPAAAAAIVPAVVSLLLGQYGLSGRTLVSPGVDFVIALVAILGADALAIGYAYELDWKPAAIVAVLHFAFAVALVIPLNNIFGFV